MRKNKHGINSINTPLGASNVKSGRRMSGNYGNKKLNTKKIGIIVAIIIALIFIFGILSEFIIFDQNKTMNLVINNNNITANLKNEILIKDDVIYLSKTDIANFFDKYIYEEPNSGKIITTYDKKIAEVGFEDNTININGSDKKIYAHAIKENNEVYLPISEMTDVYGIEINNIEETKVITMDSTDRKQEKCTVSGGTSVKSSTEFFNKTIDRVEKGNSVIKISDEGNGWTKIRTEKGKVGYVKSDKLTNEITIRENMDDEKQIDGKVNMTWDYYSKYAQAPERNEKIEGINVVSPSFFYLDSNGNLKENIGDKGKAYIEWAHNNGYKIWPMVSNAEAGLEVTSSIMSSYEKRKELIESIADACVEYKLDGINIDFENMKEQDKDLYSRFIIELAPRIKENGDVLSVDVTAPDGGETWSMCFDRNVIGNEANYIVFMAYDEYGVSSTTPGTTAGYDWIKLSLNKFLQTEEIDSDKIILAIPFYTRLWAQAEDGKIASKVVAMKDIDSTLPEGIEKKWNDELKQYYVEFEKDNVTLKMWIEDETSIKAKLSLITENNLAGVAEWAKGMESDNIWNIIKQEISK